MYKLKNVARRGGALLGAVGLLAGIGTSALPGLASADALNPLTERSLTLSSSSPGWSYLDGSGNTTYAPPHSGANGQKTGETYSFRVSSTATVKAMTFQFCIKPAGDCMAPGDNGFTGSAPAASRNADTDTTTDLNVVTSTPTQITPADWATISASADKTPDPEGGEGNFVVLWGDASNSETSATRYTDNVDPEDWDMTASVNQTSDGAPGVEADETSTGANNFITITSATGLPLAFDPDPLVGGDYIKVIFFGTDDNYITNPGSGAFFVRINTYSSDTVQDGTTLLDGGVTVANMMNESITIQTKVLETMQFSVGTFDPNTYNVDNTGNDNDFVINTGITDHVQCATLLMSDPEDPDYATAPHNVLQMGDSTAEFSLDTDQAYYANSYWRLSSNSSGGATVYYTGHTLTNTVGDEIAPILDAAAGGTAGGTASTPGSEQFGLGIAHTGSPNYYIDGDTYGNAGTDGDFAKYLVGKDDAFAHLPRLDPLVPTTDYGNAATGGPKFAFNPNADTYAIPLATESTDVVNCVTAKMRYIANIAATTPAGIYTTKVNYVAAPQY